MMKRAADSARSTGDILAELKHAIDMIRAACKSLDEFARLAPAAITDQLNEVEGQSDLGVTANNLATFALELERSAEPNSSAPTRLASAGLSRPPAPSKSRSINAKAARHFGQTNT